MNLPRQDFDAYVFSKQPSYDEPTFRKEFAKAMALRTAHLGVRPESRDNGLAHLPDSG